MTDSITSRQMNRLDNNSESLGIDKRLLMELAGSRTADYAIEYYGLKKKDKVAIICGPGNNGGDAFVAARHLAAREIRSLVIIVNEKLTTKIAQENYFILKSLKESVNILNIKDTTQKILQHQIKDTILMIDGLLGTGLTGNIREPIRWLIELMNKISKDSNIPILSIDIPSGMDPDNGTVEDIAIEADSIITFHRAKPALDNYDSIRSLSENFKQKKSPLVYIAEIGIPIESEIYAGIGDLKNCLQKRKKNAYKGQYGKLLIIGGSKDYSGAPGLAGLAASQLGIDLVIILTVEKIAPILRSFSPNLIVREVKGDYFNISHIETVNSLINWADAILIGPGLGRGSDIEDFMEKLLKHSHIFTKPLVFDADGISVIASKNLAQYLKSCLLTPHRGELTRLIENDNPNDRDIQEYVKKFNGCILAKGPIDKIISPQNIIKNYTGCPEMSVGGTGDILAGLCASFLSLGNSLEESAAAAAFLNGMAGELCLEENGVIQSQDMVRYISKFLKKTK